MKMKKQLNHGKKKSKTNDDSVEKTDHSSTISDEPITPEFETVTETKNEEGAEEATSKDESKAIKDATTIDTPSTEKEKEKELPEGTIIPEGADEVVVEEPDSNNEEEHQNKTEICAHNKDNEKECDNKKHDDVDTDADANANAEANGNAVDHQKENGDCSSREILQPEPNVDSNTEQI